MTQGNNLMKAIVLHGFGDTGNLVLEEAPVPLITNEEVLVKVKSAAINPIDAKTRSGKGLSGMLKDETPLILGWDISGIVTETGESVTAFKKGDEVFGMVNFPGHGKAYAEYVAAPAAHLALKPLNISFNEAAAASLAALTAWQSMKAFTSIQKGQKVLIHAAAGGVGHYAVQIAKYSGAWVAGTASVANRDFVLGLGADKHINYNAAPLEEQVSDIDFVLDTLGGESIDRSIGVMKKGATIISIPSGMNEAVGEKAAAKGMHGYAFKVKSNGNDMKEIASLLEKGIVKSHVSDVFSFADIAKAHAQIETGRTKGKVVVAWQ
ncbi:NADP-dependent oxidoreductase [Agriterribacter sp.]|uniref:NADP-dependent oxidoreductase n=1 Tax=Agriterribacter sp. TaxID=2821509 RepID=UPI002BF24823|nr:NADP-dependent oxidoreductase [Agriterribacter sp.]HRP54620.1 NADP-dependent oxidoreductase [Agriterribacter sp.]